MDHQEMIEKSQKHKKGLEAIAMGLPSGNPRRKHLLEAVSKIDEAIVKLEEESCFLPRRFDSEGETKTMWTDKQQETIDGISTGLMMHKGNPCECGGEHYTTRSIPKYSDTVLYEHTCRKCGNSFETWTEG